MIYFVSKESSLFDLQDIKEMSVEESLNMISSWTYIQFDTETSGRDCHICKLLCMQFGSPDGIDQIVVDCSTIDPLLYKEVLESKYIVGQNLKFDLQFLYNYRIIPRKVYDTMIVEQLLYLGFPPAGKPGGISYSLTAIAKRYLDIDIDKTIRGEIIWRGLDYDVIKYAANDVKYLCPIMDLQIAECKRKNCLKGAQIECNFVPVIAYLEWCGIHLDQNKWKAKMLRDKQNLHKAEDELNKWAVNNPKLKEFTYVDNQGDLFTGFNLDTKCLINWSSSQQVIKVAKKLGFDVNTQDKQTGEDKESVMEKQLKSQKGIEDTFLKLYFDYQGYSKVVSSFGQGHLNAINPITDRIHTTYKQLGAASGRMSCGSQQSNIDLAKLNKVLPKDCKYPNIQQLPSDEETRACFTSPKGYLMSSCDYSALESRLGADIYNEKSMLDEFLHGSGDMHSLCAYMVYKNQIPRDTPIKEIKKLYPHLRKSAKNIEFSQQFGGSEYAIQGAMGCSLEEALDFKNAYAEGFPGIAKFKEEGSKFVRENGYILMCKYSGHKMYWWDHDQWVMRQKSFTPEFWEEYKLKHKGTNDEIAQMVSKHFRAASKYDRLALNSVTQGSGIIILKIAMTNFFNWIVDNNYFGLVELSALVHDESVITYREDIKEAPIMQKKFMEEAAAIICKKLPIPAEAEVSDHWVH